MEDSIQQPLPPGLLIVENFVSAEEEEELINLIEWNQSEEQKNTVLKHRQVKHFGYEFRYDINNVDVDKPLVDAPIPRKCDFLYQRLHDKQINDVFNESPHQLTVNKYEPGQGKFSSIGLAFRQINLVIHIFFVAVNYRNSFTR